MTIIEDTRNQVGKHIQLNKDLEALGNNVIRSKLYVGDYTRLDNQKICIDTKKNWLEVASNLTKQHKRFKAECERAKLGNIRLIILVEEEMWVSEWKSPCKANGEVLTSVDGKVLEKIIRTMEKKYGVLFVSCKKSSTAVFINELLS